MNTQIEKRYDDVISFIRRPTRLAARVAAFVVLVLMVLVLVLVLGLALVCFYFHMPHNGD
jgi:diacylglycerol kinase